MTHPACPVHKVQGTAARVAFVPDVPLDPFPKVVRGYLVTTVQCPYCFHVLDTYAYRTSQSASQFWKDGNG